MCPVKIDIPAILVELRAHVVDADRHRTIPGGWDAAMKAASWVMSNENVSPPPRPLQTPQGGAIMAADQAKPALWLVRDGERATRIELASSVWKIVVSAHGATFGQFAPPVTMPVPVVVIIGIDFSMF